MVVLNFLAVGTGSFIGACARYALVRTLIFAAFPAATLLVNVAAGFLIGAVIGFDGSAAAFTPRLKLFVNTGLLGGLSTFSTFSLETITMFENGKYLLAAVNITLNLALSLAGTAAGLALVRSISAGAAP